MNDLNMPLFRAEVKDSKFHREDIEFFTELIDGKRYVVGLLCTKGRQIEVTKGDTTTFINIDNSTLAINFPDITDSQGNKIFASLSEDGKGGDIMKDDEYYGIAKYKDSRFVVDYENVEECLYEGNFEEIGIQE